MQLHMIVQYLEQAVHLLRLKLYGNQDCQASKGFDKYATADDAAVYWCQETICKLSGPNFGYIEAHDQNACTQPRIPLHVGRSTVAQKIRNF